MGKTGGIFTVREFLRKYSYSAVGLFVKQIAISIFGLVLAIACGRVENDTLKVIASCGAILFYLFLLYAAMWETGSKDRFGVKHEKFESKPLTGLYISLIANSLNILLALIIAVSSLAAEGTALYTVRALCSVIALFIEGMYTGLLSISVGGAPLNDYWFSYFIIIIPSLVVSALAYYFGIKDYHYSKIFIAENPEEAEIKREKKKARKKEE